MKSDSEEENEENSSEKFEDANDTASWAPSKIGGFQPDYQLKL